MSNGVSEEKSIVDWILIVIWVGFLIVIIKELPMVLRYIGKLFNDLAEIADKLSFIKRLLFGAFILGYFYLIFINFWVWYIIATLVFPPLGYTYDKYKWVLARKLAGDDYW